MKTTRLLITLAAATLWFAGCRPVQKAKPEAVYVKVDTVGVYGNPKAVAFPGKVMAASDVNLSFRVAGKIERYYADKGQYVQQGQLLAELDPRDYQTQFAATEAEYKQISKEANRIIKLYETQSVTPTEYEKAVSGLEQITAKYELHKNALEDTKLRAPFSGYVQSRLFERQEMVGAGMPVISMISTGANEVEINLPVSQYVQCDNIKSFTCRADVFPGREFPLVLTGISRKANLNQLYTARLRFAGTQGEMPGAGMSVMVNIEYKDTGTAPVIVPVAALFEIRQVPSVWIYDPQSGRITVRNVRITEIMQNGDALIESGLQHGDIIVTAGVHSLLEGQAVKILQRATPANVGGML